MTNTLLTKKFDEKLDEAAELKFRIGTDLKEDGKEILNTYLDKMASLDPAIKKIAFTPKKKRTDEEKSKLSAFIKMHKKLFKDVRSAICPVVKPDGSVVQPLEKMVRKIAGIYQMLVYLGNEDILAIFKDAKISFDLPALETLQKEVYGNEETKQFMQYIFKSAKTNAEEIQSTQNAIKTTIYMELDENIRHSPENKEGITASQFGSLASQKATLLMKSSDEYRKFKEKKLERDEAALVSLNNALEKAKEI